MYSKYITYYRLLCILVYNTYIACIHKINNKNPKATSSFSTFHEKKCEAPLSQNVLHKVDCYVRIAAKPKVTALCIILLYMLGPIVFMFSVT